MNQWSISMPQFLCGSEVYLTIGFVLSNGLFWHDKAGLTGPHKMCAQKDGYNFKVDPLTTASKALHKSPSTTMINQ